MLGFGGDDEKEKLKENMEEIKDLIDRDDHSGGEELNPPEPSDFPEEDTDLPDQTEPDLDLGQEDFEREFSEQETGNSGNTETTPGKRQSAPDEETRPQKEPGSVGRDLNRDIPEPAETKEIDVPEIDKGPLFIRRGKFERALEMIDEMFYLSREVEETVNQLESGLQRDRETEKQLRELLQGFESNRGDVERIVSPGED